MLNARLTHHVADIESLGGEVAVSKGTPPPCIHSASIRAHAFSIYVAAYRHTNLTQPITNHEPNSIAQ